MARMRKFVNEVPGEALTRIEVGVGSFATNIPTVVRLAAVWDKVLTVTGCVDGMRPGVVHARGHTMGSEAEDRLQPVVIRVRGGFELVDIDEIGVGDGTAPYALIDVAIAEQLPAG